MIDDALTSTRTSQRLLLAAAAITLIFVLSLADVRGERLQLADIRRLRAIPVENYSKAVWEQSTAEIVPLLKKPAQRLRNEIDEKASRLGLRILGTDLLQAAFEEPIYGGRLYPESVVAPSASSLERLDQVYAALPIDRDAQMVVADLSGLEVGIVEFLVQNSARGALGAVPLRIDNVLVQLVDAPEVLTDSFLPSRQTEPELALTFELRPPDGPVPIFELRLRGVVKVLPNSSYRVWLARTAGGDLLGGTKGKPRWLSDREFSPESRRTSIPTLEEELVKKVESATAKNRTISLPGIEVPGALALFGIPLVLLGLALSFLEHLRHLRRLVPDHRETFTQFAWTPLMQRDPWYGETLVSALLMPAVAQGLLAWRYDAFELPPWLVVGLGISGSLGSILIGRKILGELAALRRITWRPDVAGEKAPKENLPRG